MIVNEFLVKRLSIPDSRKRAEEVEVAVFPEGKCIPEAVFTVSVIAGFQVYGCDCCGEQRDARCVHVAVFKTFRRQGYPEGRIYFLTDEGRIGYWKGQEVELSKVDAVNR